MKFTQKEVLKTYKHLAQNTRNFLQSPQCREFLFFLFFVLIASTFWILHTLDEEYETEISIPLRLKNVPENVIFTSEIPSKIGLKLEDKGTVLVKYQLGQSLVPVTLDFEEYKQKGDHIRLTYNELTKKIQSQLVVSTRIKDIIPDTLEIIYTQGKGKKVPVQIQGDVVPMHQYHITGQRVIPDSVIVYAPQHILNTINVAYTQKTELDEIADTGNFSLPIISIKGAKFVPNQIDLQVYSDILTEKTVSVPIEGFNFPAEKQLKTFPSKVNITFLVGMQQFKDITSEDFSVGVTYETIMENISNDHCQLQLTKIPTDISHIKLSPSSVEYIIEHKIQP